MTIPDEDIYRRCIRIVSVSDRGQRIGEHHPNAKLTDHDAELIRQLHEAGISMRRIGRKFEVSLGTIQRIVNYESYTQAPSGFKEEVVYEQKDKTQIE